MAILAHYENTIVEVLDIFVCGGVALTVVRAIEGDPFVGGDRYPVRTPYATVKANDLEIQDDGRDLE